MTPTDGLSRPIPFAVDRHFDRGAYLIRDGDDANAVYLLRRGQVRVFLLGEDGRETVTAVVGHSQLVGIAPLLGHTTFHAFAQALTPVDAWAIPASTLRAQLPRDGVLLPLIVGALAQRLALEEALVRGVALLPLADRVRDLEARLAHTPDLANAALRQKTLAELVGAAPETLSRLRGHPPKDDPLGAPSTPARLEGDPPPEPEGAAAAYRQIAPGALVQVDAHPGRAWIVAEGIVSLFGRGSDGREILLCDLEPGDLLDVGNLLGHPPSGLLGVARTPVRIREIDAPTLLRLLADDPARLAHMMRRLGMRLLALGERLARLSALTARDRLALLLCDLAGTGAELPPGFTHDVLAHRIGTRRETVTRALADLKRGGHLEQRGRHLRVLRPDRLRAEVAARAS